MKDLPGRVSIFAFKQFSVRTNRDRIKRWPFNSAAATAKACWESQIPRPGLRLIALAAVVLKKYPAILLDPPQATPCWISSCSGR